MSKEIYFCDVLGDGSINDPYRVALFDVDDPDNPNNPKPFVIQAVVGNDPGTGAPLYNWALAIAESAVHSAADGVTGITRFPRLANRSTTLAGLSLGVRTAMLAAITGKGVDLSAFTLASTYGDILEHLVQLHQPLFPLVDFDVTV